MKNETLMKKENTSFPNKKVKRDQEIMKLDALPLQKPPSPVVVSLAWRGLLLTASESYQRTDSFGLVAGSAVGAADLMIDSVISLGVILRLPISIHQCCMLT